MKDMVPFLGEGVLKEGGGGLGFYDPPPPPKRTPRPPPVEVKGVLTGTNVFNGVGGVGI